MPGNLQPQNQYFKFCILKKEVFTLPMFIRYFIFGQNHTNECVENMCGIHLTEFKILLQTHWHFFNISPLTPSRINYNIIL